MKIISTLEIVAMNIMILFIIGCSSIGTTTSDSNQFKAPDFHSEFYDLSSTKIPSEHYGLIKNGIIKAEELLKSDEFLAIFENKTDWKYTDKGEMLREAIRARKNINNSTTVKPKLTFYTPPKWGFDECNGFSFWPFKKTKSTGCSNSVGVQKNVLTIGGSYPAFSKFIIHEWLHSAGYGHAGNFNQCSKDKRNSVPIYVACVAERHLRNENVSQCSQAC